MNGYEEKIKNRLFLEVCNAAGREEWDGLAHQQKENLMLVCRLSGYDEKFQRDCGLVTREQMEHWGIEEEVLFQDAWANMFAKRPPLLMDFEDAYGHHYDQNILSMEKKPERIWRTDADFYVLTNNMDHGAVYMMDEATLQKSAEKLDGNLIVLPASIHDVYLMVEREGLLIVIKQGTVHHLPFGIGRIHDHAVSGIDAHMRDVHVSSVWFVAPEHKVPRLQ